jgi:hypothetical protein
MTYQEDKEYSENFLKLKAHYDTCFKKYWGEKEGRPSKFAPISIREFEKRIKESEEFARKWGEFDPLTGELNQIVNQL